ncbi:DHBP synthase RibB-like alpha/beta domain-containing protein [Xylogone sp. PMI_703]|nr:DHBP synthase RibB-like alpha/beta domain-containing protein [Xylogone sp. PMI_703]
MGAKIADTNGSQSALETRILPARISDFGKFKDSESLDHWEVPRELQSSGPLHEAAQHLKTTSIPVAFPTETVYGLGADATRSDAVKGIYKAKGRPSDNPLIMHFCDLSMLRSFLLPSTETNGVLNKAELIPEIYKPLIKKFWPGPLTILLKNPQPSKLAPEVTAGLPTFGARMPSSPLALSLIKLAGVPLAAPSANASTKPSPTAAEHVLHDLNGKIELILDGGSCQVGVESTVVDGLCDPPVVLRPGGVSIDKIRECHGWETAVKGYKDRSEVGSSAPRAPGMKYKHYSPKAKVVLYEATSEGVTPLIPLNARMANGEGDNNNTSSQNSDVSHIGIIRTKKWAEFAGSIQTDDSYAVTEADLLAGRPVSLAELGSMTRTSPEICIAHITEIYLGNETKDIARGLFFALRELDRKGVDVIYVEGIEDQGDIAAAVMNRLRKAATDIET